MSRESIGAGASLRLMPKISHLPANVSKINLARDPNRELARRLCKKLYIGKTGRRLGDRFQEHLRSIEKDVKNTSEPGARQFNLPNLTKKHMVAYSLSLYQGSTKKKEKKGSTESSKTLKQKFIFQIRNLNPHGIN